MLGLDPDNVVERIRSRGETVHLPDLRQSIAVGAIGFTIVSVLMFGVWAMAGRWFYAQLGPVKFYALLGVGFMAGGGGVFAPLLIGKNLGRFYVLFVGSFFTYAGIWMVCWFTLQMPGEWIATVLGPGLIGVMFAAAFGALAETQKIVGVMIVGHTVGYFVGEWLFAWAPLANRWGMLIWGVTYGLGFGGAIGASLFWAQSPTRNRLLSAIRGRDVD